MKIVFGHNPAGLMWVRAREKRRARHFPSSGEVFLFIALTLEPPKSGRGQAIKRLLKHYWYCQKGTEDVSKGCDIVTLTALIAPVLTKSVKVPDEHQSNLIIEIAWDSLRGEGGSEAGLVCRIGCRDRRKSESSSQKSWVTN